MDNSHFARLEGAASLPGANDRERGPSTAAAHAKRAPARVVRVNP